MPNTRPVPDSEENLERLNQLIAENAQVRVLPYASITVRQAGKEHVDFKALANQGAFAFTDDGVGVQQANMMYEAMQQAAKVNKAVVAHCEDNSLIYGGAMHEGQRSEELGIQVFRIFVKQYKLRVTYYWRKQLVHIIMFVMCLLKRVYV